MESYLSLGSLRSCLTSLVYSKIQIPTQFSWFFGWTILSAPSSDFKRRQSLSKGLEARFPHGITISDDATKVFHLLGCVVERPAPNMLRIHQKPFLEQLLRKAAFEDVKERNSPFGGSLYSHQLSKTLFHSARGNPFEDNTLLKSPNFAFEPISVLTSPRCIQRPGVPRGRGSLHVKHSRTSSMVQLTSLKHLKLCLTRLKMRHCTLFRPGCGLCIRDTANRCAAIIRPDFDFGSGGKTEMVGRMSCRI